MAGRSMSIVNEPGSSGLTYLISDDKWDDKPCWHFFDGLKTTPPQLVCCRANKDHDGGKCAITGSTIFNSECTRNCLSVRLNLEPSGRAHSIPTHYQAGSGGGEPQYWERTQRGEEKREKREREGRRKMELDVI